MKRILIMTGTLVAFVTALGAIGAYPHYIEELCIGGGVSDPADGGADFDKQGNIATGGWINTAQQYRVNGAQIATQNLANATSIGMLNENESVTGAWTFTNPITNTYDTGGLGYTQTAREMVIGLTYAEGRYCAQQDVTVRAGRAGGNYSVILQPNGTGGTMINKFGGTGGITFGNGAGGAVGIVDAVGNASFDGDIKAKAGHIDAGVESTTRGLLNVWSGAGGSTPGCVKLASPNGTLWYLFVEDDGTLKIHNALPTQNSNGTVIGLQF